MTVEVDLRRLQKDVGELVATHGRGRHPLTIVSAFCAAPITSLTPVIGAGYVTAFVQSYLKPPLVKELSGVMDDVGSALGWWRNRLLRIFLVFALTTFGSIIGTWVGGAEIVSNLFG